MKKFYFLFVGLIFATHIWAQSPQKMSYQAVIRNSSGGLVTSSIVGMKISILQGSVNGTSVYVETQMPAANANGLVSLEIGVGTVLNGNFSTIDWSNGPYFIKTETDPSGGAAYSITGTNQMLSVPYALYAATAGNNTPGPQGPIGPVGPKGDTGAVGATGPQGLLINGASVGNTPYWDGSQWVVNSGNFYNNGAGVGIGTSNPNASAKVEIASTTQGFLPPRLTTAQRDAINAPAAGLTIYNTTDSCLQWWIGTRWYDGCGNNVTAQPQYPAGSVFCASGPTAIVDVTNPTTGKIWMDRNLGATQVAASSTDANSYGDMYQWGRRADGHQCRTSPTTTTLSSVDQPAHGSFITSNGSPNDWRVPQNTNLWQGVNGVNNPCPSGYRIPTEAELSAERLSWSTNNAAGAFASPLKLPVAGERNYSNGSLFIVGSDGSCWSSTVSGTYSSSLLFNSSNANMFSKNRANGFSVRCIKD